MFIQRYVNNKCRLLFVCVVVWVCEFMWECVCVFSEEKIYDSSCTHVIYFQIAFNSRQYVHTQAIPMQRRWSAEHIEENIANFRLKIRKKRRICLKMACAWRLAIVQWNYYILLSKIRIWKTTMKKNSTTTKSMRLWIQIARHHIIQHTFAIQI